MNEKTKGTNLEYIRKILLTPVKERDFHDREYLKSYFTKLQFFDNFAKAVKSRARQIELERIVETYMNVFQIVYFNPGDVIYAKNRNIEKNYIIMKGTVSLYKEHIDNPYESKKLNPSTFNSSATLREIDRTEKSTQTIPENTEGELFDPTQFTSLASIQDEIPPYETKLPQLKKKLKKRKTKLPTPSVAEFNKINIGKVSLYRVIRTGDIFGPIDPTTTKDILSLAEDPIWALSFETHQSKIAMEEFKKNELKVYNLLESIIQKLMRKEEILILSQYFNYLQLRVGQRIYTEGDPTHSFYFVVNGTIALQKNVDERSIQQKKYYFKKKIADTSMITLDRIKPGNSFGEELLNGELYRKLTAVSHTDYSAVLVIDFEGWKEIESFYPKIAENLTHMVKGNAFWRQQRLQKHLNELNSARIGLEEITRGIDLAEEEPKFDFPLDDPRKNPKLFSKKANPLLLLADPFLKKEMSPKRGQKNSPDRTGDNFKTFYETNNNYIRFPPPRLDYRASSQEFRKSFFKFRPTPSDLLGMTIEEKEIFMRKNLTPTHTMMSRYSSTGSLKTVTNHIPVEPKPKPTNAHPFGTQNNFFLKRIRNRSLIGDSKIKFDGIDITPDIFYHIEPKTSLDKKSHLMDKQNSHVEKLETIGEKLEEITTNITRSMARLTVERLSTK